MFPDYAWLDRFYLKVKSDQGEYEAFEVLY